MSDIEGNNPDIIYYNADLTNDGVQSYIPASYKSTRSDIIINNPSKYYCSVIRFNIDGSGIPLLIFPSIDNDDITPNNTYYQVIIKNTTNNTIKYGYVNFYSTITTNLINIANSIPLAVWNIQDFLDMCNIAISDAFSTISKPSGYNNSPFLWYDIPNQRINLICEPIWDNEQLIILFNAQLYNEFGTFQNLFTPKLYDNDPNPLANFAQIVINNTGNNTGTFTYQTYLDFNGDNQPTNSSLPVPNTEQGVSYTTSQNIVINRVRYYRDELETGTFVTFNFWVGVSLSYSQTFTVSENSSGYLTFTLSTPQTFTSGSTFRLSFGTYNTYARSNLVYPSTNGAITANGAFTSSIGTYPGVSLGNINPFVDFIYSNTTSSVSSLIIYSQFASLYNMVSLRRILLTSSTLPITPEFISGVSVNPNSSSSNNTLRVLSDFVVPSLQPGDYRSLMVYYPSAEYRLLDLVGTTPIKQIEITFYWIDNLLNIRPMTLRAGETLGVKLLFRRKAFNSIPIYRELEYKHDKNRF
jgi:hypothetical protein